MPMLLLCDVDIVMEILENTIFLRFVTRTSQSPFTSTSSCMPFLARCIDPLLYRSKTTFEDVVKEGQDTLHDVGIQSLSLLLRCLEPWVANTTRTPSTAFCILLKFFMYRLSFDELFKLLRMKVCLASIGVCNDQNCPHLRAIGFLYIRFAVEPKQLWNWLSPYFDESEEFEPFMDHVKMYVLH